MSLLLLAVSDPSKVPFYICGGLLAVWAVTLAAIGLSRPEFPNNLSGQRGVIGISFVLIVLAIGAAIISS
ncbi:MAG: hypothetical protein ACR2NR_21735 [Solirubrobacteraceae bacterium]